MTPIEREELEKEFMKMPELEQEEDNQSLFDIPESTLIDFEPEKKIEETHHELSIESSMVYKDRFCLGGTTGEGDYLSIWFDSYELLKCLDEEKLKEIKSKLIKTIKEIK